MTSSGPSLTGLFSLCFFQFFTVWVTPENRLAKLALRGSSVLPQDFRGLQTCAHFRTRRRGSLLCVNRLPVHKRGLENVFSPDLIVEHVEAVSRLVLRLAIQLDLKFPNPTRRCQTHRQSPFLPSFTSTPEVRALSSAGITRPQRSYGPLRLPAWPSPFLVTVRVASSARPEPPPLAADRPPCMPRSLPR